MLNKYSYSELMDTIPYIAHKVTTGNASYPYHRHASCEVYLFIKGNVRFYIEKSCYKLAPNDLFILNPNEMHRIVCDDVSCYERISINVTKSYMEQLSHLGLDLSTCFYKRPIGKNNILSLKEEQVREFIHLSRCLQDTIERKEYGYPIKRDAYASLLLLFIHTLFCQATDTYASIMPDYIYETMQFIELHLYEPIDLSLLEKKFHINGTYLSQEFKKHTGLTLRAFLLDRKISCAKSLLSEGKNVTQTCYLSGFNDYANFIRSFTKAEGISPGKYRKLHYTLPI